MVALTTDVDDLGEGSPGPDRVTRGSAVGQWIDAITMHRTDIGRNYPFRECGVEVPTVV